MSKSLLLLAILLIWGSYIFFIPKTPLEAVSERLMTIQGNTLSPVSNPNYTRPIIHTYTLGCMMMEESTNNPSAYNPDDPNGGSCGCLQFQKPTFSDFCLNIYSIGTSTDSVWNCDISRRCADYMLIDGYGHKWTTYDRCLKGQ